MNQEQAFLDAICADPEEVGVRLVYADWLETDSGRPDAADRAGFIRVQMELDAMPPARPLIAAEASGGIPTWRPLFVGTRPPGSLMRPDLEGIDITVPAETELPPPGTLVDVEIHDRRLDGCGSLATVRRDGLVLVSATLRHTFDRDADGEAYIAVRLDNYNAGPGPHAERRAALTHRETLLRHQHEQRWAREVLVNWMHALPDSPAVVVAWTFRRGLIESVTCLCQGWLDHGAEMVKAAPLREVRLSDKQPRERTVPPEKYGWSIDNGPDAPPWRLPDDIASYIKDAPPGWLWPSRDAALKALSDACLRYARKPQCPNHLPCFPGTAGTGGTISVNFGPPLPFSDWKIKDQVAEPIGLAAEEAVVEVELRSPAPPKWRQCLQNIRAFGKQAKAAVRRKRRGKSR